MAHGGGGHGHPSPASAGSVEDGPYERQAGAFAWEPVDHLDPPAGLAKGALDEVGVAEALVVLDGEEQVGEQAGQVLVQAGHGGGEPPAEAGREVGRVRRATAIEACPGSSPVPAGASAPYVYAYLIVSGYDTPDTPTGDPTVLANVVLDLNGGVNANGVTAISGPGSSYTPSGSLPEGLIPLNGRTPSCPPGQESCA